MVCVIHDVDCSMSTMLIRLESERAVIVICAVDKSFEFCLRFRLILNLQE